MFARLVETALFALLVACTTASCASRQALADSPTTPTAQTPGAPERPPPPGAHRAVRALDAIRASGVLNECWQAIIDRSAPHRPERATITVGFDADGRVSYVTVEQACDPALRACIQQRVSNVRIERGQPIDVQASFNLAIEGDARAPQPCLEQATTRDALAPDASPDPHG